MSEKVDESSIQPAVEPAAVDADVHVSRTHKNVVEHARSAAEKEQNMTLLQGIRLYPKAIFFSVIISTCIVMEGYDVCLINNFCMSCLIIPHLRISCILHST